MSAPPARVRCLTAPGPAGVAVVEVRGPDAGERVARLTGGELPPAGSVRLVRLRRGGDELDEALLCVRGPASAELHLHGSPPLVEEVLAILRAGPDEARAATPATLEERAWELVADAPSELGARVLLDQAEGALRRELERLRREPSAAAELRARWRRVRPLLVPARVVLAGPVNAGKSTLFNVLVGERRVAVSGEPGTTRDAIAERVQLGPYPVELFDTAGEGFAGEGPRGALDREGQALARALRVSADLVLWLAPVDVPADPPDPPGARTVVLASCADRLAGGRPPLPRALSARDAPDAARETVRRAFLDALELPEEGLWIAGEGAPFDDPVAAQVEAAFARPPGAERDALLERLGTSGPGRRPL